MSKIEKDYSYVTQCLKDREFMFIARPSDNNGVQVVIMPITEEQEKELDNNKSIQIEALGNVFIIDPELCYAYGELDLSPNSEDIKRIAKANWFHNLYVNIYLLSDYDYETHSVTSDVRGGRWYETDDVKIYLPYLYACINKPKRVAIFKDPITNRTLAKRKMPNSAKNYEKNKDKIKARAQIKLAAKRKDRVSNLKFTIKQ